MPRETTIDLTYLHAGLDLDRIPDDGGAVGIAVGRPAALIAAAGIADQRVLHHELLPHLFFLGTAIGRGGTAGRQRRFRSVPGRGAVRGEVSPLLLLLRSSGGASTNTTSSLLLLPLLLLPLLLLSLLLPDVVLALGVQALEAADLGRGDVDAAVGRGRVGAGPQGVVGVDGGLPLMMVLVLIGGGWIASATTAAVVVSAISAISIIRTTTGSISSAPTLGARLRLRLRPGLQSKLRPGSGLQLRSLALHPVLLHLPLHLLVEGRAVRRPRG